MYTIQYAHIRFSERPRHAALPRAAPTIEPIGGVGRRETERYRRIDLRRAGSLARRAVPPARG